MEEYKIINGKRHYRRGPNDSWKLCNRSLVEMKVDYQGSPVGETKIVTKRPYQGQKKRKRKKTWKKWIPFFLVGGVLAGAVFNYIYISDEEIFLIEYLNEWSRGKDTDEEN